MPRRRNNLSLLNKALFLAVIAHAGLFFWSTTAIVPGGGLGPRVLNALGISDVSLSLHPSPRSTTSDIALSIRQQSSSEAPVPAAIAPQAVASIAGAPARISAPPLQLDLPASSFGSSPLAVHVAAPAAAIPEAPRIELPSPADLITSAAAPRITPQPIEAGPRLQVPEQAMAAVKPPSAIPMQTAVLPPPVMGTVIPPAAMARNEKSAIAPLAPPERPVAALEPPAPNIAVIPAAAPSLNLPDLPPVVLPDRVVEVAKPSAPVSSRILPEASQPQAAGQSRVATPAPVGVPLPAPAALKPEVSLAAPPVQLSSPAILAPPRPEAAPAAVTPTAISLTPPTIDLLPSLGKIDQPAIAIPESIATAPAILPAATKIDEGAPIASPLMSVVGDRRNILQQAAGLPPRGASEVSSPQSTAMAPAPPSIASPPIAALSPAIGAAADLGVAPPKIGGPAILSQRAPEQRRPLIEKLGGTAASETAVDRGLGWLAKSQERDGRWTHIDDKGRHAAPASVHSHDMALTGLSVLAFLAADHSPVKDGPYREPVAKAIKWLMDQQGTDGDLRGPKALRGPGSAAANFYDHAIATMALAEAALMTRDKRTTDAALAGARFICANQNLRTGGWRYLPAESGDTSVFGWQILALHDCEQLGFDLPPQVRDRAIHYLTLVSSGTFGTLAGYLPGEKPTPVMSAEALLCRVLLGQPLEPAGLREVSEFLTRDLPQTDKPDLYYWYYASLSLAQMQTNPQVRLAWDRWNARCRDTLIATQSREAGLAGSWADGHWGEYGGRVFSTALATLTLEVYYRYLPMQPSDPQDAVKAWRTLNPPRAPAAAPARPRFDAN